MQTSSLAPDKRPIDRQHFFRLVGTGIGAILLNRCLAGCAAQGNDDPIRPATEKLDFTLRLDDKNNENLNVNGGYVIANDVIVARTKDGNFVAVSAECTHAGTKLTFKSASDQFYCPLHLSRFDTSGKVLVGPASLPLKQYKVTPDLIARTVRVFE
ncbi:cytochrome b6-f complex iron-sulfur subunit [Spirosoma lacussanchae]|uniref:QcrA and Rieske domain-containing protein n=1 Tax=Spirosoma lacussanchae TaxID=1884249 RepID=UPI0011092458|nr:Rieske (2Fe-2S) protein [Spirosoma lacussanchae]